MKRNIILGLAFVMLAVLSGFIVYQAARPQMAPQANVFCGYLVCQSCATSAKAMDGTNPTLNPAKHTVSCLKMQPCMQSGYGLFIKKADGNYTYYKFDQKGSDLAYRSIICKTVKTDNLMVEVTGKMQNGIIVVTRMSEK